MLASIDIGQHPIKHGDEAQFRSEFYDCAARVDLSWTENDELFGNSYYQNDFGDYPLLAKYLAGIRYIEGQPLGVPWMDVSGDGGAFDPTQPIKALKTALDAKSTAYVRPEKQSHLAIHRLDELSLLVHGGFNAFAYNTPTGRMTVNDVAKFGSDFYRAHPNRMVFDRVWFFDSLDSADQIHEVIGLPPGYGRMRWLAQLWPDFRIYSQQDKPPTHSSSAKAKTKRTQVSRLWHNSTKTVRKLLNI